MGGGHDLPVLLIDIDEVSLKTLVHLGGESRPFMRFIIESKKYLEKDHL